MTAPVPGRIGTPYRKPGRSWALGRHTGVDYPVPSGTVVKAPSPSSIVFAGWGGWGRAYGLHVVGVTTVNGKTYRWITAHMSKVTVRAGQVVAAGQPLGLSGNTGNTSGPHVHFEVRVAPFGYGNDVNPAALIDSMLHEPAPEPVPSKVTKPTTFDVLQWNVASPRWFTPWRPRAKGIQGEIRGDASVNCFQEVYSEEQAATLQEGLGGHFVRVAGRAGLELFYDGTKWDMPRPSQSYASGIQGRYAQVVHLRRLATGQHVAVVNTHAPALYPALRTSFGKWLGRLLGQVDGPIVLCGDFNTSKYDLSPRREIKAAGFRSMHEQIEVTHEGSPEFTPKGSTLAGIYTRPGEGVRFASGEVHLTAGNLSDHRELTGRVVVTPKVSEPAPSPAPVPSPSPVGFPSSVLDLDPWKLTTPFGPEDHPTEVKQPGLNRFADSRCFFVRDDGVVFRTRVDGVTTSGSSYPRCELRELDPKAWSTTSGTHTLKGTVAIAHLPKNKPIACFGQIHGGSDDIVRLLAERRADGRIELTASFGLGKGKGSDDHLIGVVDEGQRFSFQIHASGGTVVVSIDGVNKATRACDDDTAYFKAGLYLISNTDYDDADEYGEVVIYALTREHR